MVRCRSPLEPGPGGRPRWFERAAGRPALARRDRLRHGALPGRERLRGVRRAPARVRLPRHEPLPGLDSARARLRDLAGGSTRGHLARAAAARMRLDRVPPQRAVSGDRSRAPRRGRERPECDRAVAAGGHGASGRHQVRAARPGRRRATLGRGGRLACRAGHRRARRRSASTSAACCAGTAGRSSQHPHDLAHVVLRSPAEPGRVGLGLLGILAFAGAFYLAYRVLTGAACRAGELVVERRRADPRTF